MPIPTPLMGLLYPGPDDAPCDFDEQWCAFTSGINGLFDRWETGLNRAYPAIPAAKLLLTELTSIGNSNPIPFNEVEIDTAGMTNMDADPYGIVIPRTGRYTAAGFLEDDEVSGGAGAQCWLIISTDGLSFDEVAPILILGAGTYRNNIYWPVLRLDEGDRIVLMSFNSPQPVRTARRAWLSVTWHSELVRPS